MLVTYRITNYKSFGDTQMFDLRATQQNEFPNSLYEHNDLRVNKKACIIGPNGSGKSQLLRSLIDLCKAVNAEDLKGISQPFRLNNVNPLEPTKFEVVAYVKNINSLLSYTLSVLNGKVIEESLYCRKNEKNQHNKMIFNRSSNKVEISPDYSTHEALLSTVTNTRLIIKVLSGLSIDVIDQYITWCSKNILIEPRVISYEGLLENLLDQAHDEVYNDYEKTRQFHKDIEDYANKYLHCFGINVEKVNISLNNENKTTISVIPKTLADEKIRLTISEAKNFYSTGSFNLITLFILLGIVHHWTGVILFDEIDSTFHHKLSKEIINIISSDDNNSPQLILTTHDILLLDNNFRRDSIYTITKGEHLKSHIDRVSKYSIRKDAKLSLKYLSDEFGALPRILENYCD
ncbi:AAA family ATPase [Vibrio vulnificus]|nr:AAA family ATPase [Vibrio vulnificus]EHY1119772.1 AAA family ATPase [Vibrio vulnificus]